MKSLKFLLTGLSFLFFSFTFNGDVPGLDTIKAGDLLSTVEELASPEYGGRLSGSEGYEKAAEYMAGKFKKLGLKPAGDDEFFQYFNVEYNDIKRCNLGLVLDDKTRVFELGSDYVCRGFTGSNTFTAPVVFAGYGISLPDRGYDDYTDVDAEGKVVMVFKYNPRWKLDEEGWPGLGPRDKSRIAKEHGAVGIMFVSFPNDKNPQKPIGSVVAGSGEQIEDFPQVYITIEAADEFLEGTGYALKELQTSIDENKKPLHVDCKYEVDMDIQAEYTKEKQTMNVLAVLEGSDSKLKDEYVIVSAHLDHVGTQADKIYFPGANDNASGSAAVLEIAEAFVEGKVTPERSVMFVLFAAEESGLEGATYCADNLPFPVEKATALLNMDCIGYGDSIRIGSGKTSPVLWNLTRELDKKYINMMVEATWGGGGADATPFYKKGIPTLYFVTTNSYEYLHQTGDKPETLNSLLYEKITRLAYLTAYEAAMGNYEREVNK